ncbi:MAG: response regulator, partial [Peptococcaceae bacterium]|nr:response regulator [Peptococcaceae bacterium]
MSKYILVADDREGIRDLLTFLLDSLRYQVRTAVNGLEVLALLREELPQLAVVDLKMPEINGIQLMEKIREYAPDLPV